MEKRWKQFKRKTKNFYGNIKNRSKFLSNLKVILILILIEIYTIIYDKITKDVVFVGNQQILIIAGLAIVFTLIFSIFDGIIESLRLKELKENNKVVSREMGHIQYNVKKLNNEQMEIAKLGSKYEYCWNYFKKWAINDKNGILLKCMNEIENLADDHVKKEYKKLEEKERNFL